MKVRWAIGVVCLLLAAMTWVQAQDKPAEATAAAEKVPMGRMFQPWSKMSSLSDDQKLKIRQIHGKANAEIKVIRDKEEADILALLNDEQKAEFKSLVEAQKARTAAAREDAAAVVSEKKDVEKKEVEKKEEAK